MRYICPIAALPAECMDMLNSCAMPYLLENKHCYNIMSFVNSFDNRLSQRHIVTFWGYAISVTHVITRLGGN